MPMVMVTVIVMPVARPPRAPVVRVVVPTPWRMPNHIIGHIYVPDQWPGCNDIGRIVADLDRFIATLPVAIVARVGRFAIVRQLIGFNDVVFSVKVFIPDELDQYLSVVFFLHKKYSHILVFAIAYRHAQGNGVQISIHIVRNPDIVNVIVAIQVQIIDLGFLVVQFSFKTFQCFRLLKQFQYSVKVQVIAGQVQFFLFCLRFHGQAAEHACDNDDE